MAGDSTVSERDLVKLYQKNLTDDLRYRTTTLGVHRDDLTLALDAGFGLRPARRFASQGQMRSIVLALKFATLEYVAHQTGEWPILLLDDVESELDVTRKEALSQFIRTTKSQVMVTTTDATQFESELGAELSLFTIEGGGVKLRGVS
jgi:DNA replication and repair protein RecF